MFKSLIADGIKDLAYLFVLLIGAIKQWLEGIVVNSEDRMWPYREIISLAFWTTCLYHSQATKPALDKRLIKHTQNFVSGFKRV